MLGKSRQAGEGPSFVACGPLRSRATSNLGAFLFRFFWFPLCVDGRGAQRPRRISVAVASTIPTRSGLGRVRSAPPTRQGPRAFPNPKYVITSGPTQRRQPRVSIVSTTRLAAPHDAQGVSRRQHREETRPPLLRRLSRASALLSLGASRVVVLER